MGFNNTILTAFLFGVISIISAQTPIQFNTDNGLPSNHVYVVKQDLTGNIWISTNRGIAKYNGACFKTFTMKEGLPNNDIWHIEVDEKNRIWYASKSNYQGYILNDSVYKFPVQNRKVISPSIITLGSNGVNYDQYELKNDTFRNLPFYHSSEHQMRKMEEVNKKSINLEIFPSNHENGTVLALSADSFFYYDKNLKLVQKHPISVHKNKVPKRNGATVSFGNVALNTYFLPLNAGFFFYNSKSNNLVYSSYKDIYNIDKQEPFTRLFLFPGKNTIQIYTDHQLLSIDAKTYKVKKRLSTQKFPEHHLAFKDKDENLWLASSVNGVTLIPNSTLDNQFLLMGHKTNRVGIINNQLICGASNDGFYLYKNGSFTKIKSLPKNKPVYGIKDFGQKKYFVTPKVFSAEPPYSESFIYYSDYSTPISKRCPLTSCKDVLIYEQDLWIVTHGALYHKKADEPYARLKFYETGLKNVSHIGDQFYVGGSNGLLKVGNNGLNELTTLDPIAGIPVNTLQNNANFLIVGTDGNGVYFAYSDSIVKLLNTNGLIVQRVIKKDSFLWLATQRGVKKVLLNPSNLEQSKIINSFYRADGLIQDNVNDIFIQDSFLYAASDIGLAKLNLNNAIYKKKPQLFFNHRADTLHLSFKESRAYTTSFAVLDFVNQKHLQYQYRILPIQHDWKSTPTTTLNFSNLNPGLYCIEVRATDQHLNSHIAFQYLYIKPEWWQTWWAKTLLGLICLLLIYLIFKLYISNVKAKADIKSKQEQKVAGLELQALRSQMNPHFVHNSLNAIQYYIQRNEVERSENYLSRFAQLVRLFFEYSRNQNISVANEIKLLKSYLEIEKLRFEEKLNFNLIIDEKMDTDDEFLPSMVLQPIVENAVNHGLFHKKGGGTLTITFTQLNLESFEVIIEDNGIGIKKAKQIFSDSSKNYRSKSSAVLADRLELLKKSKEWDIAYTIVDLSDINAGTGTRVKLIFKQIITT